MRWSSLSRCFLQLRIAAGGRRTLAPPTIRIGTVSLFLHSRNDKLLRYWDDFADRLGKIRAGMNLQGAIRRLALFDPPIDPALLVRAGASGIDVGAAVAGLNKPFVPVRAALLLQRAIELAGEVRSLGGAALSAMEKRDAEDLALMRQGHELRLLQTQREIRLLQWKQAEEATEALLRTRASTLDRYSHYLRQLGETVDASLAPDRLPLRRSKISEEITAERFDELYAELVQAYDRSLPQYQLPRLRLANSGGGIHFRCAGLRQVVPYTVGAQRTQRAPSRGERPAAHIFRA